MMRGTMGLVCVVGAWLGGKLADCRRVAGRVGQALLVGGAVLGSQLVARAQTTGFDIQTFVDDVDVKGTAQDAATAIAPTLLTAVAIMLALVGVAALVMWVRRGVKAK